MSNLIVMVVIGLTNIPMLILAYRSFKQQMPDAVMFCIGIIIWSWVAYAIMIKPYIPVE